MASKAQSIYLFNTDVQQDERHLATTRSNIEFSLVMQMPRLFLSQQFSIKWNFRFISIFIQHAFTSNRAKSVIFKLF